jgi:hypothetical protein
LIYIRRGCETPFFAIAVDIAVIAPIIWPHRRHTRRRNGSTLLVRFKKKLSGWTVVCAPGHNSFFAGLRHHRWDRGSS